MRIPWREMRAVFAALGANLGIALAKFIAFAFTGSASMLAEAVHSVADTGNEVLLLVGRGRSLRPPSDEHPFGFGRERYFYGFVVSVMLFTVGAAFSVYDGIHKILNPEQIRAPQVAIIILVLSAVLEAFSLRTGVAEANKVRGDRNWGTFIRRTKAPELPVVLLEDLAALIGLGFAFVGVTLAWITPANAKPSPIRAARSSSRTTGSSGALVRRMNVPQPRLPRTLLASSTAVRSEKVSSTAEAARKMRATWGARIASGFRILCMPS